ncbi:MAG: hypothetical protein HFH80_07175 [Lachnospiraceae bacterium]|nr:hypothetical protein [Lachnospiraceae bacterium]
MMDNLRIRKYMDQLFENAPINHRTLELKEELIANALEKYNDLTLRGYGEDEAFQQVVGSLGNVQQLFADMGTDEDYSQAYYLQWAREAQEKKAALTAVSAGLFLLAGAVLIISLLLQWYDIKLPYFHGQSLSFLGIGIALLICIVPVSMLIYAHRIQPPVELTGYAPGGGVSSETRKRRRKRFNQIKGSLEGLMWLLIVIFYFIISFATHAWYITWILFLIGAAVECLLDALIKIFFPVDRE